MFRQYRIDIAYRNRRSDIEAALHRTTSVCAVGWSDARKP